MYAIKIIERYPSCCSGNEDEIVGIFNTKKELNKALKKARGMSPILFKPEDICIIKFKSNEISMGLLA